MTGARKVAKKHIEAQMHFCCWKAYKMGADRLIGFIRQLTLDQACEHLDELEREWRAAGVRKSPRGMLLTAMVTAIVTIHPSLTGRFQIPRKAEAEVNKKTAPVSSAGASEGGAV
jgi:hypothetical protein